MDVSDPALTLSSAYEGKTVASVLFPDTPVAVQRGDTSLDKYGSSAKADGVYLTGKFDLGFANLASYATCQSVGEAYDIAIVIDNSGCSGID
jgi:hypothetical protein